MTNSKYYRDKTGFNTLKYHNYTLLSFTFFVLLLITSRERAYAQNGIATRDEIQLMEILKRATETKLITLSFKDSVEMYMKQELRQKKNLLESRRLIPSSEANRLGVKANLSPYLFQTELKKELIRMDRFSAGIDGYYKKMIEMAYFNDDWAATKEQREAMDRLLTDIRRHLNNINGNTPQFLRKMNNSNNSFVRIIGALLSIMNNGANRSYHPSTLPPQLR